jgi:hypothetical protein
MRATRARRLRPDAAPAHSAQTQIELLERARRQLPLEVVSDLRTEIVMWIAAACAATTLCQAAQDARINFLAGTICRPACARRSSRSPRTGWRPSIRQDGSEREGAQIAEVTNIEARPDPVAGMLPGHHPPRATPPGRAADLHRRGRGRLQATLTDLEGTRP